MALGLYIHVPFCSAICNYCTFNRGLFDPELKAGYVAAVIDEIRRAGDGSPADTIFFGGGTPSLLDPVEVKAIVDACREAFAMESGPPSAFARSATADKEGGHYGDGPPKGGHYDREGIEVTLEANPESVTEESLAGLRAAGINRLSFGVQSFSDDELRRLSRLHSASRAIEAFSMARAAGFDNISLDLMMWLPGQSIADWLMSVDALIAVNPDHASLYLLEIYPHVPLRETMAASRWAVAPDDDAAEMYLQAMERLDVAGYEQYEISNVARAGQFSRHNLKYWTDGEWLGFGPGAHSTRAGVRWRNVSATAEYTAAVRGEGQLIAERRVLSRQDVIAEALFTRLRLTEGISIDLVESRYGVDVWREYGGDLQRFVEAGILIYDGRRLKLTRAGMLLANEVMETFLGSSVR
jgi:oxygen-independent coproporphyrinogen-3 oxidase